MKSVLARLATAVFWMILVTCGVSAAEPAPCSDFAWPLETELAWMGRSESVDIETGGSLKALPQKAITLSLAPAASAQLPVPSSAKKEKLRADSYSGWFTLSGFVETGLYQISLSHGGWIDAVQNGVLLSSTAHSGSKTCPTLHKSVRFEIGEGPLTVEISGATAQSVRITIQHVPAPSR